MSLFRELVGLNAAACLVNQFEPLILCNVGGGQEHFHNVRPTPTARIENCQLSQSAEGAVGSC